MATKKNAPRTVAPKRSTKSTAQETVVDRDQVARRAYQLFIARGETHGHDLEDWLAAERDVSDHN